MRQQGRHPQRPFDSGPLRQNQPANRQTAAPYYSLFPPRGPEPESFRVEMLVASIPSHTPGEPSRTEMLNQLCTILVVPVQFAVLATQEFTGIACERCHEYFTLYSVVYQFRGKFEFNQCFSNYLASIAKPFSPLFLFRCGLTVPRDVIEQRTVET